LAGILTKLLPEIGIESGLIELPSSTGYVDFVSLSETVPELELVCQKEGASRFTEQLRMIKDDFEIALYRELSSKTNIVIQELEKRIRLDELRTEMDIALFLERISRELDCEGMSFETLCAGPTRSHNIHAFPQWTKGSFAENGLSLVDFGLKYQGYASDITLTVAREPLNSTQKKMLALVERAYAEAFSACACGVPVNKPAAVCDKIFAEAGFSMPHSLGHGLGLETHEAPILRNRPEILTPFEPGMVFTIEPGLYHPEFGGVRWENDVLMTKAGPEQLTQCKILYR
jgi:Xaa-Pro dipeptidase